MLVYEYELSGSKKQYAAIDEAICVVQFIRNKSLRLWMDNPGTNKVDTERKVEHVHTSKQLGIDIGLKAYLTDSGGEVASRLVEGRTLWL